MTLPAPTYDLVLLLDPQAEDDARAKIVADARASDRGAGRAARATTSGASARWPTRSSSSASAEYHLLQFHAGPTRTC